MPKIVKKDKELEKIKSSQYYKFVYFISEKLIIWNFLIFILFYFNSSFVLQKMIISLVITFATAEAIKGVYIKKRPSKPLLGHKIDSSFPSSHAAVSSGLFFSSIFFSTNIVYSIIMLILAVMVSVGRVLGGAHYKIDVIGGLLLSLICVTVVYLLNLSINLSI